MFDTVSLPLLIIIFGASAGAVWIAGIHLSDSTDVPSTRWHMGEALGGLILLAIVTNLPEVAITASGALQHNIGIAIGNILGGMPFRWLSLCFWTSSV